VLPNIASYSTYGGEKQNYSPVVDPTTDLDAGEDNEARSDVACLTVMSPRAYVAFTYTSGTGVTVVESNAVWGNTTPPTVTRTGTGVFTITWPTTITDPRGNTQSVNLRRGWGNVEATVNSASVVRTGPNTVTCNIFVAGTMTDPGTGVAVVVYVL